MSAQLLRPPTADDNGKGTALALVVHVGLVAALAWGVSWRGTATTPVAAELWSAVPQVADAPAPLQPPPAPTPKAEPEPVPKVEPKPEPKPEPPPKAREADIALEKKKKPEKPEPKPEPKKPEPKPEPKVDKQAEAKKLEAERKADEKARAAEAKSQADRAQRLREDQMRRLNEQLGGTGSGKGTGSGGGTAAQTSAPSSGYAGRVVARVRPNIIFTDQLPGHPTAEVTVRLAPDGMIIAKKLVRSSGVPEWDQAVLRAVERTEVLPRDVNGTVPSEITIAFDRNDR